VANVDPKLVAAAFGMNPKVSRSTLPTTSMLAAYHLHEPDPAASPRPVVAGLPVVTTWFMQAHHGVRFDWGPVAAATLAPDSACIVIVDVLSFTTSVTVATERGIHVYPYLWRDRTAAAFAAQKQATLAVGRRSISPATPWSLSPAALRRAPFTPRLVLPSPNGSAIAAASSSPILVAGSLCNAAATGRWLADRGFGTPDLPVTVIAAGERWPDDSLRPALEDLLGAGAIIAALHDRAATSLSPEAAAARACFQATPDIAAAVANSASGLELAAGGFTEDAVIAAELDTCTAVPVLTDQAFSPAAHHHAPRRNS
jgi:2-phosphosulfolactate phosphatase